MTQADWRLNSRNELDVNARASSKLELCSSSLCFFCRMMAQYFQIFPYLGATANPGWLYREVAIEGAYQENTYCFWKSFL